MIRTIDYEALRASFAEAIADFAQAVYSVRVYHKDKDDLEAVVKRHREILAGFQAKPKGVTSEGT